MGKSDGGSQGPPKEFMPGLLQLFNSTFQAARDSSQVGEGGQFSPNLGGFDTSIFDAFGGAGIPQIGATQGGQNIPTAQNFGTTQPTDQAFNVAPTPAAPTGEDVGLGFEGANTIINDQLAGQTSSDRFNPFAGTTFNFSDDAEFDEFFGGLEDILGDFPQIQGENIPDLGKNEGIPAAEGPPIVSNPFPGQFNALPNQGDFAAIQGTFDLANQFQNIGDPTIDLAQQQIAGDFLDPMSNPFFLQALQAGLNPGLQNFERTVAPQFNSAAVDAGLFGGNVGSRDQVMANISNDLGRNILDVTSTAAFDQFNRERQIQQQSPQMLAQGTALSQISPQLFAQGGEALRGSEQIVLDEILQQFREQQTAPFNAPAAIAAILAGQDPGTIFSGPSNTTGEAIAGAAGLGSLGLGAYDIFTS